MADAYEVSRQELIRDARTAWTWSGPADELIVWVSKHHDWPTKMAVGYVAALGCAREWNEPPADS